MKAFTLPTLFLATLLALPACPLVYVGAGAAVGAWAMDQNSDESGSIILPYKSDLVFAAAQRVAHNRGVDVVAVRGSRRLEFTVGDADVIMQVLEVADNRDVCHLKVRARELIRSRGDLAEDLAASVESELEL
ncbi:MAG: hypothetical protein QGH51_00755 [Planctomycetota bacterium]|jgi:hypothetical protein|nr:hypothetical protein [Planctomycetota bacterium]